MEEENKYYTPNIEEFCVGFEFEFETGMEGWKKFQFNKNRATQLLINVEDFSHQFRVKYLDKSDIESLGWNKFIKNEAPYIYQIKGVCYYLWNTPDIISINKGLVGMLIKDTNQVFRGTIKNKSELKKLMHQLGI